MSRNAFLASNLNLPHGDLVTGQNVKLRFFDKNVLELSETDF